jgi:hypothetical protein
MLKETNTILKAPCYKYCISNRNEVVSVVKYSQKKLKIKNEKFFFFFMRFDE